MPESDWKLDLIKKKKKPHPSPILILIRHAEAYHNATDDFFIRDPVLTPTGIEQCKRLREILLSEEILGQRIDMIVSSPMRRSLQTVLLTLDFIIDRGIRVIPNALWQETSNRPCDIGTNIIKLAPQFPSINFFNIDKVWPRKIEEYAYKKDAVLQRAQKALVELYSRKEKVIAVVSHGHFLRTAIANKEFYNADMRIFIMKKKEDNQIYLVERKRTIENGGYLHRSNSAYRGIEDRDFPMTDKSKFNYTSTSRTTSDISVFTTSSSPRIIQEGHPRRMIPPLYYAMKASAEERQRNLDGKKLRKGSMIPAAQFSGLTKETSESLVGDNQQSQNTDLCQNMAKFGKESESSVVSIRWPYGDFIWPET